MGKRLRGNGYFCRSSFNYFKKIGCKGTIIRLINKIF